MIDWTKPVQTRDGRKVRVYATDGGGDFPIHAAVQQDGAWYLSERRDDGRILESGECPLDIINVPETRTGKLWVVVWNRGLLFSVFTDKFSATNYAKEASQSAFAIVPIEFTCTRGQGLE